MLKLYDYELSGNCYKVRLMLAFLGLTYKQILIEFYPSKQHKSQEFFKINPLGQLPVISDQDILVRDAQAILIYLAAKYDRQKRWYPTRNPAMIAQISEWLFFANDLTSTSSAARLHDGFFYTDIRIEECRKRAHELFRVLDEHLYFNEQQGYSWICHSKNPTIADIACFPYIILSEEGGISRINYPAIRRWCDRFKRIPHFTVMPGVFPAGPDKTLDK
ncbi:MAG: glutathione S-transferase family protein [Paracoccaceae bacterium]|nr:glutathione S-transferase family protein [Paracoccaceae bacterium]